MNRLQRVWHRASGPRVPAAYLLVTLVLMTAGWGYAWYVSTADEPLVAPPGYVYVTVPYSVPHPGEDEGWLCQNVGSSESPNYLDDPLCLVRADAVTSGATPVESVGGGSDALAATMTVITGAAALITSLGAVGVRVSRNSTDQTPGGATGP